MKKYLTIFDLDGTLFDTRKVNFIAYQEALEGFGFSINYEYFCNLCNGRHYTEFLPVIIGDRPDIMENVHIKKNQVYSQYLSKVIPNKYLLNLISIIKDDNYIAIVTTASKKNTQEILKSFFVYDKFDLIITYEDVMHKKPAPDGFLKAMKHFDMTSDNTIIFEDSDVGIEAASLSGARYMRVYGYG